MSIFYRLRLFRRMILLLLLLAHLQLFLLFLLLHLNFHGFLILLQVHNRAALYVHSSLFSLSVGRHTRLTDFCHTASNLSHKREGEKRKSTEYRVRDASTEKRRRRRKGRKRGMGFANREVRPIISKIIVYTAISQNVCQKIMNLKNWGILNFSRIPTWLMPASSFPLLCRLRWRENSEEKWEGGRET